MRFSEQRLVNNRIGFAALRPSGCAAAVALALCLGAGAPAVHAFGLGEPEVSSALGQPLKMRVPLQPDTDVDLSPQCLRLLGSPRDPIPTLTAARLTLEEAGSNRYLHIDSLNPVNEPVLRVVVDAGCVRHVQREFSILLDPPAASGPESATAAPQFATLSPAGNVNVAPADATVAAQIGPVSKLDLGVARVVGRIGEPILLQIPITGSAATSIEDRDVLVAAVLNSDGTPLHNPARFSLSRSEASATLQLMTAEAVSEPALRAVIEIATPEATVRREYGVLLELAPAAPAREEAALGPGSSPAPQAAAAAPAGSATEPKAPEGSRERPAAEAPVAALPPPKLKRPARPPAVPHAPSSLPLAPPNTAQAEAPRAPPKAAAAPAKPPAASASGKAESHDRLVLSAPDEQALAAAARLAEMDQRVKDLTQEIVRLRTDLTRQQAREQELIAQQGTLSGSWLLAIGALAVAGLAGFLLLARRRGLTDSWNAAQWEDHPARKLETGYEAGETLSVPTRMGAASPGRSGAPSFAGQSAAQRIDRNALDAGGHVSESVHSPATFANTSTGFEPIGGSASSTKIEVTEVQGNEASIDQLYTLFYDVSSNTDPNKGARGASEAGSPAHSQPGGATLDIDLGLPGSKPADAGEAAATPAATFTYQEHPEGKAAVGPAPDETSKDTDFPRTQPALDLDLTTDINTSTVLGPRTELPRDDSPTRPPATTRGAGTLELDLSTGIAVTTQAGPTTEMPREDESAQAGVELDLDTSMLPPEDRKAARPRSR